MVDDRIYDEIAAKHNVRRKDTIFQDANMYMLNMPARDGFYSCYDTEQAVLGGIRQGDVEGVEKLFLSDFGNSFKQAGYFSDDYYKNFEYVSVTSIALYARAAIEGGVCVQTAYALQDYFLHKLSKVTYLQDYYDLNYEAPITFANIVRDSMHTSAGDNRMNQVREYIRRNVGRHLTEQSIAGEFNMSADHLSRLFHKELGVTMNQYIRQQRVYAAQDLLKYTGYALSDISAMLGFSSQSYFGRIFKCYTGVTPAKYRAENKKSFEMKAGLKAEH